MKRYIHTADAVFALVLFCAFALSMMLILTTGATAYQDIRDAVENRYSENTCIDYVATKVRHFDEAGNVYVENIGGTQTLCLAEELDGTRYITYIYFYDGFVRELYVEEGYEFAPEDGETIIEVNALQLVMLGDGLIRVTCTGTGGRTAWVHLGLRGTEAVIL